MRSGRLIGMARWADEAAWRVGVRALRAAVTDDPFDEWKEDATEGNYLEELCTRRSSVDDTAVDG